MSVDRVPLRGIDDVGLAAEHAAVEVDRDEERVGPVGDVLDEAGPQPDERGVVVHRGVETPPGAQVGAREHQVADAAIRRSGTDGRCGVLVEKRLQPLGDAAIARSASMVASSAAGGIGCGQVGRQCRDRLGRRAAAGSRRSSSRTSAGAQLASAVASRDAFFRKSDGPSASPRKRRTSPVEAPSS